MGPTVKPKKRHFMASMNLNSQKCYMSHILVGEYILLRIEGTLTP